MSAQFQAVDPSLAGVDRLGDVAGIAAEIILHEGRNGLDFDEAVDLFVEGGNACQAARREIVLIRQNELGRAVRIEVRISGRSVDEFESAHRAVRLHAGAVAREVERIAQTQFEQILRRDDSGRAEADLLGVRHVEHQVERRQHVRVIALGGHRDHV